MDKNNEIKYNCVLGLYTLQKTNNQTVYELLQTTRHCAALGLDTNLVKKASKYHDAVYFLKRYKGALMMQTGYKDDVAPSATHFAAYNQFTGSATMLHLREMGHNYPEEYWLGRYSFFNQHLTGFLNPFSFKKTYNISAGDDQKNAILDSVQDGTYSIVMVNKFERLISKKIVKVSR